MPTGRLPLNYNIESRTASTSKDSRLVNALVEDGHIVKRPGLAVLNLTPALPTGQAQGLFSWSNYLVSVNTNYVSLLTETTRTTPAGLTQLTASTTTFPPISFSQTAYDTYLVFHDGSNIYTIDNATKTLTSPISGTGVLSTNMVLMGGYYATAPTVTFSAPGAGGTVATGTAVIFNHQVNSINITAAGVYPNIATLGNPTITIAAPPAGTQAAGSPVMMNTNAYPWGVVSVSLSSSGSSYLTAPNVTFVNTPANTQYPATGYTILNTTGQVTSVVVTNAGSYYYGIAPTIVIDAPTVTTAQYTVSMSNTIQGPYAPGLVYLNGSFYVLQIGTSTNNGRIHGSALEDPTTWPALNFITAGSDPDGGVGIVRHLNYIVAFGEWSTEFFYDAGLGGTGSPLLNYQSAKLEIGCASGYTIASAEQTVLWVGATLTGGRSVYMLDGTSPVKVSTKYIDKYLNKDAMVNVKSFCMKLSGHSLYVLALEDQQLSLVYDLDEKHWYEWTSLIGGVENYFTPTFYSSNVEYRPNLYLQDDQGGMVYKMSADYYNDNGIGIQFRAVSPRQDSGTVKRKFYTSVEVVGDKVSGTLSVRHSDDDYATWSGYRTVNLIDTRPILYQNGTARRRAWEVYSQDSVPIRLEALEMDYEIGEQGYGEA